jgi:hypothetical protein
MICPTQVVQSI